MLDACYAFIYNVTFVPVNIYYYYLSMVLIQFPPVALPTLKETAQIQQNI